MRLKTIKEKTGDTTFTKYIFKAMDLVKKKCKIEESAPMYLLSTARGHYFFLCNGLVYIANTTMELNSETKKPIVNSMELIELYKVKMYKDYPKNLKDIAFYIEVLKDSRYTFTPDEFFDWIDSPCDINYKIDAPYYEIIKFLNGYNKETFRTDCYLFYSKRDDDYNFINNIYAFDVKNNAEIKLYITTDTLPRDLRDIVIDNVSGRLSKYRQRECKKAFLKLLNESNVSFGVNNYCVMELVKLAVQPVLVLHEWSCHRCFCKPNLFGSIWVYDFPDKDEEPSFFITDGYFSKVAVLKFKSPEYLFNGIYKRGMAKAKGWKLSTDEIDELLYFLNSPSNRAEDYGSGKICDAYRKYVKTKWQQLIFEYNHNTAGWGWGDKGFDVLPCSKPDGIEQLPFDLTIPNYKELFNNKQQ